METFENLIPELHKKHYIKENATDQTISIYKNNRYNLSATIMLNHDTGQALFTKPRSEEGPRLKSGDEFAKTATLTN